MARPLSDSPMLFDLPVRPDFRMERAAAREGIWPVCGTDEAGRGPLAGPVVAAAVILDPKRIPKGLDDSKRMTHAEREAVFGEILKKALAVSVASVSAHSIDCSDIRKASLEAMCRAVKSLHIEPMLVLADGRDIPPGLTCGGKAVVKGDQRSQSIAAASIIAKVTRDRMMTRTASIHAGYGFDLHMGYATVRHRTAIEVHGPLTRLHRLSFSPFRLEVVEAAE